MGYKIHVSVWGNDATSLRVRQQKDMLEKQIDNYRGDSRAVFVYTFTRDNIDEAAPVIGQLSESGCKTTFNMFSAPEGYEGTLRHTETTLAKTRAVMLELLARYPGQCFVFALQRCCPHAQAGAARALRLPVSAHESFNRYRPGPLIPAVPL